MLSPTTFGRTWTQDRGGRESCGSIASETINFETRKNAAAFQDKRARKVRIATEKEIAKYAPTSGRGSPEFLSPCEGLALPR